MLVSKITPAAKKIMEITPFQHEEVVCDLMIVNVQKYVIGSIVGTFNDNNIFEAKFGRIKLEKNPDGSEREMFDAIISHRVRLTTPQVDTWGLDDHIVHELVANAMNFQIVSSEVKDIPFTV
jgi:hypothetical protein